MRLDWQWHNQYADIRYQNKYGFYFTESNQNEAVSGWLLGMKVWQKTTQRWTVKSDWQLLIFSTPGVKGIWLLLNEPSWSRCYKHASVNSHPQRGNCAVITVTLRHRGAIEFFTGLRKRQILLRSSCGVWRELSVSLGDRVTSRPQQSNCDLKTEDESESFLYWICVLGR